MQDTVHDTSALSAPAQWSRLSLVEGQGATSSGDRLVVIGATVEVVQVGHPLLARTSQCIGHSHSLPADLHLASNTFMIRHIMHSVCAHKQSVDAQK